MNIKILSDSTCDLPQEVLEKYNITMIPLAVIIVNMKSFNAMPQSMNYIS